MSRPLKIPVFLQPKTKPYCGLACIKMVASFFGKEFSLGELIARIPSASRGVDMCSIGTFLMNLGFESRVFINMRVVSVKTPFYKYAIRFFIKQGGLLIPRAIKISDIRKALARGYPIILFINNEKNYGHYVVIKNVGKKMITVNCPDDGLKIFGIKRLIAACRDWGGGAIIVRPNRK